MAGIPSLPLTGSDATAAVRTDRTTLAVRKALQEQRPDAHAMVRLIEGASAAGKGQLVNYKV